MHMNPGRLATTLFLLLVVAAPSGAVQQILDASGGPGPSSGLNGPVALATDPAGNVFVGARNSNNVFKITPAGAVGEIINVTGAGLGSALLRVAAVAADAAGNAFVVGSDSDNAFRIAPNGTITRILSAAGDGLGNLLDSPSAIAVDSASRVFVAGLQSHNVFMILPNGDVSVVIDGAGAGPGALLALPSALAVDGDDNLYVLGQGSDNVLRRTPEGILSEVLDAAGDGSGNAFDAAFALAAAPDGSVYASAQHPTFSEARRIFKVAPGGAVSLFTTLAYSAGQMAVDSNGRVFVSLGSANGVTSFSANGTSAGAIINAAGDGAGRTLNGAYGLAVDANNNVFVTGFFSNNVFKVPTPNLSSDLDGDLVPDGLDNCTTVANGPNQTLMNQIDADRDGFGNACDKDLTQDGWVLGGDYTRFLALFNVPGTCPLVADFTGDCLVLGSDFAVFVPAFGRPVGPSGLACANPTINVAAGDPPCLP